MEIRGLSAGKEAVRGTQPDEMKETEDKKMVQEIFDYVKTRYNTVPDYPWHDANAVLRHADNRKWYGLVMEVGRDKIGLSGDGTVDVINVKCDPEWRDFWRCAYQSVLPAYHMNKEHWNSIILDGSIPDQDVKRMIGESYDLCRASHKKRPPLQSISRYPSE